MQSLMPLLPVRSTYCKGEAGAQRRCRGGIGMRHAGCAGGSAMTAAKRSSRDWPAAGFGEVLDAWADRDAGSLAATLDQRHNFDISGSGVVPPEFDKQLCALFIDDKICVIRFIRYQIQPRRNPFAA